MTIKLDGTLTSNQHVKAKTVKGSKEHGMESFLALHMFHWTAGEISI